jgi:fatty acid desaturase
MFAIVAAHPGLLTRIGLSILIAIAFSCLGILGHEILHGSVVERLWLRRCLGALCIGALGIGANFWTIWHNIHQNPAKDPDSWGILGLAPQDPSMAFLRRFTNPRSLAFPLLLAGGVTGHAAALLFCMQKQMTGKQRAATLTELFRQLGVSKTRAFMFFTTEKMLAALDPIIPNRLYAFVFD